MTVGKRLIALGLIFLMLISFAPIVFADDEPIQEPLGYLEVNGELFEGSLGQAITEAGSGGIIGVYGFIDTTPIGCEEYLDILIDDVTIQGETDDASIVLPPLFIDINSTRHALLNIGGSNVSIKNLKFDPLYKIDFAIRVLPTASNVIIENVGTTRTLREGLYILSSNNISVSSTIASKSFNGAGFGLDNISNGGGLSFIDCETSDNLRGGVLIRNAFGPSYNVDLSGIKANEGIFCIEDNFIALEEDEEYHDIKITSAPKNEDGGTISLSTALFFRIDNNFQHIRYGISEYDILDARAYIKTDRYGSETEIYYKALKEAEADLREGESLTQISIFVMLFNRIKKFFEIIKGIISGDIWL